MTGKAMLEFTQNLGPLPDSTTAELLLLDYEGRCRTRQRVRLESGREAGLFLERGRVLAEGDILRAADGTQAVVRCRPEETITARADNWALLARGCYHLGNRHVPLQIGDLWLRFMPDPVLEKLVRQLGFETQREEAPFVPESGAYGHAHAEPDAAAAGHAHAEPDAARHSGRD